MCSHRDTRLVVDLSYDVSSQALTWVLTGTDDDGQVQWLLDGHEPLRTATPAVLRALRDALGGVVLALGQPEGPFDQ